MSLNKENNSNSFTHTMGHFLLQMPGEFCSVPHIYINIYIILYIITDVNEHLPILSVMNIFFKRNEEIFK